ncbi:MAG: hypothetical protein ACQCXQ_13500 [Verrucomicrobiales bacterium]|nr:hypothetical protein [Verrucomicrobiota bacterium JB025]
MLRSIRTSRPNHGRKSSRNRAGTAAARHPQGFALVVTISLMVMLAVVALGMLSLASISLRSSSRQDALSDARCNARLGLMLAIGQLQSAAGPDQRISAPASLVDSTSSPALTGVWESNRIDPENPEDLDVIKQSTQSDDDANGEFVGWLSSDGAVSTASVSPPDTAASDSRPLLLTTTSDGTTKQLGATAIQVGSNGRVSWLTVDEGVKARIDLPEVLADNDYAERSRLRAPERPATETSEAFEDKILDEDEATRIVSRAQGELAAVNREAYLENFHDFTPWASGLATNVVDGGLKKDLSLAFEQDDLPQELVDRRVYSDEVGNPLVDSDPYFSTLADYYKLYQSNPDPSMPMEVSVPDNYDPGTAESPVQEALDGNVVAPVVTRVNVVFSMVSRESHSHWATTIPATTGDYERNYMVYLIYTPVITLYNPYNVPLEVDNLKVTFEYLPLAFKFYRNGAPQTSNAALLSQFHINYQNTDNWADQFSVTLGGDSSTESNAKPVSLMPGEARVFGINHEAGTTWDDMTNYLHKTGEVSQTIDQVVTEGWSYNNGFLVDWLAPEGASRTRDNSNLGVIGTKGTDTIDVEFTPKLPSSGSSSVDYFGVSVEAKVDNETRQIANYHYRYGTLDRLIEAMEAGSHPTIGSVDYPVRREKPWNLNEIYQTNAATTAVENWTGPKQFAIFTLANRTSEDSLYPTKPGVDTSFVNHVLNMDITDNHPAQMPMEISFLPITGSGTNTVGSLDVYSALDPRSFFFSGSSLQTGLTNYPTYQIPRAPLMNLADLRHADLASSGHLPAPPYTVGESRAHPMIAPDTAIDRDSIPDQEAADHVWLANNTLWDGYYFSGIRSEDEFEEFLEGTALELNPRAQPYQANGSSTSDSFSSGDDLWLSSAGYQLQRGSFNVNSTSPEAWKVLLSSLREKDIPTLELDVSPRDGSWDVDESTATASGNAFPRLLDGIGDRMDSGESTDTQTRWSGFRDLDDIEIEELADAIVEGVKQRGPFLSMAEFVNRRLDGDPSTTAKYGILQEAIEEAGLNDDAAPADARVVTATEAGKYGYAYEEVAEGNTQEGAASFLSQGDLLSVIGASLSARSDTFLIRARGDSLDAQGNVIASALCEAVVQRVPEFVDPEDPIYAVPADSTMAGDPLPELSEINERFGRRFRLASFRWVPITDA